MLVHIKYPGEKMVSTFLGLLRRYCFEEEKQRKAAALMQQSVAGQGAQSIQVSLPTLTTVALIGHRVTIPLFKNPYRTSRPGSYTMLGHVPASHK